jgi:hypothetical protein
MKASTMIYEAKSRQVIKYLKELQKREKAYRVVKSTVASSNRGVLRIATGILPVPGIVLLQSSEGPTPKLISYSP